jgi:hypothetical protein
VDILGNTIESSSIYLFPFIIEYSMIGRFLFRSPLSTGGPC